MRDGCDNICRTHQFVLTIACKLFNLSYLLKECNKYNIFFLNCNKLLSKLYKKGIFQIQNVFI